MDAAIRAIQADPSNVEAAQALLANLSPRSVTSVVELMTRNGTLPPAVKNAIGQPSGIPSKAPAATKKIVGAGGVQNQLTRLLGQLASFEHKKVDAVSSDQVSSASAPCERRDSSGCFSSR